MGIDTSLTAMEGAVSPYSSWRARRDPPPPEAPTTHHSPHTGCSWVSQGAVTHPETPFVLFIHQHRQTI